jgi:hypothetical protein
VSSFAQDQDRIPFNLDCSRLKKTPREPLTYADSNILPLDHPNQRFLTPRRLDFSAILKQNRALSETIQKNLKTYSNNANASLLSQKVQSTMKLTNQLDAGLKTNFKFKKINDPKGFESKEWLQGMENLQAETDRQELLKRQPAPEIKILEQIGRSYTSRFPSQHEEGHNLTVNEIPKIVPPTYLDKNKSVHLIGLPLMSIGNSLLLGSFSTHSKATHNAGGSKQSVLSQSRRSGLGNTSPERQAVFKSVRMSMIKTNDEEISRAISKLPPQSNGADDLLSQVSTRTRPLNRRSHNMPNMNLITPKFSTGTRGFGR